MQRKSKLGGKYLSMPLKKITQALEPHPYDPQGDLYPKDLVWRDRWLLTFLWAALLFMAVTSWAVHGEAHATITAVREDAAWASLLLFLHGIFIITLLASPLVVPFSMRSPRLQSALSLLLRSFQKPVVYYLVLFAISVVQISSVLKSERLRSTADLVLISLLILCVLWLTFRRSRIPIDSWVLFLAWLIALGITRATLFKLLSIPDDPVWIVAFRAVFVVLMILLGALPLFLASSTYRRNLAEAVSGFEVGNVRLYLGLYILLAIAAAASILFIPEDGPLWAGSRLLAVLGTSLTGLLLLQLLPDQQGGAQFRMPNVTVRWFWAGMGLIALVYVILAVRIGTQLAETINPDGLVYLSIARSYAEGNPVIRGYWSPLMSWLISPAIFLGSDPFRSQRILAGLIGLAWALVGVLIARRYSLGRTARLATFLALGLLALRFAFVPIVPDMLGGVLILSYFYLVTDKRFARHPLRIGLASGIVGGFAYYAKYYNFPIFVAHILLTGILLVFHERNLRKTAIGVGSALFAFLLVSTPLIAANSSRYGYLTFSTSGSINYANMGQNGGRHPCWAQRLCDQPSDVLFPWEDPLPQYYSDFGWSPADSLADFHHLFLQWRDSVQTWAEIFLADLGLFIPLALPLFGLAALVFWRDRERRLLYSWTFLTVLLYGSGYSALHTVEMRFALPVLPLLVIGVFGFSERMIGRLPFLFTRINRSQYRLFLLIFNLIPIFYVVRFNDLSGQLRANPDSGCMRPGAAAISAYLVPPIAGSDDSTNYLAYYNRVRTLGVLKLDTATSEAARLLQELNVRTYVVSADSDLRNNLVTEYEFQPVSEVNICSVDYTVLRVP